REGEEIPPACSAKVFCAQLPSFLLTSALPKAAASSGVPGFHFCQQVAQTPALLLLASNRSATKGWLGSQHFPH
ncbi:hypothetical protein LEMLEM_LOCUS7430, partial [Lemmus lemmus]